MRLNRILRPALILMILTTTIGCDQVSKRMVRQNVDDAERIALIKNHLTLTRIENTGAFLSVGASLPKPVKIFVLNILPTAALILAVLFLFTKQNLPKISLLGICFLVGGGIGNLYDRLLYGSVTDFLHIKFGLFQTGIFNLADVSITLGVCLILFQRVIVGPRSSKPSATGEAN